MKNELIKALTAHSGNDNLIPESLDYSIVGIKYDFEFFTYCINRQPLKIKFPAKIGVLKISKDLLTETDYKVLRIILKYIKSLRIYEVDNYLLILFKLKFIYNFLFKIKKVNNLSVIVYNFTFKDKKLIKINKLDQTFNIKSYEKLRLSKFDVLLGKNKK
jgi:hypothetical protein